MTTTTQDQIAVVSAAFNDAQTATEMRDAEQAFDRLCREYDAEANAAADFDAQIAVRRQENATRDQVGAVAGVARRRFGLHPSQQFEIYSWQETAADGTVSTWRSVGGVKSRVEES